MSKEVGVTCFYVFTSEDTQVFIATKTPLEKKHERKKKKDFKINENV